MNQLLDKPKLWTFKEAAEIFGLPVDDGFRTIRTLVKSHGITVKQMPHNNLAKGLNCDDLEILAKALNKSIEWPESMAR